MKINKKKPIEPEELPTPPRDKEFIEDPQADFRSPIDF